jgi:hypothetical protein
MVVVTWMKEKLVNQEREMSASKEQMDPESQAYLPEAIVRLHPKLHEILGPDSPTFLAELDVLLAQGDSNQLVELFRRYPAAYQELQEQIDEIFQEREGETSRGGSGLFGDPHVRGFPGFAYRCNASSGTHWVALFEVRRRNLAGQALCPEHNKPLTLKRR